ncbi:MAG: hypothetical protein RIB45_05890 [Marivibrio sp.]|uniref:hypothetical protein n=1 Tax=Marivibrio sp. TaxID=2039719 RepID=UPI0032EF67AA
MSTDDPRRRFQRCEHIALEAERLYDEGCERASAVLLERIQRTCLFKDDPCPHSGPCRRAIERLERKRAARGA